MKVIINKCFGGFGFSNKAFELLISKYNWKVYSFEESKILEDSGKNLGFYLHKSKSGFSSMPDYYFSRTNEPYNSLKDELRCHKDLIAVLEELSNEACGRYSELKIVEVPDDVEWTIEEYNGVEWVAEIHKVWE